MHMEIIFDEEKVKAENLTINGLYEKVDNIAKSFDLVQKDGQSILLGNNDKYDFSNFGLLTLNLKEDIQFLKCIQKWILYLKDEVDDLGTHYKKKAGL